MFALNLVRTITRPHQTVRTETVDDAFDHGDQIVVRYRLFTQRVKGRRLDVCLGKSCQPTERCEVLAINRTADSNPRKSGPQQPSCRGIFCIGYRRIQFQSD